MSMQSCAACNAAPAQLYCSADNAFLCAACDVVVHSANKLAQRHARVPLTFLHRGAMNPDPELRPTASLFDGYETNGTDKTQPAETYLEDSDESQETLLVPSGSYRERRSRPPTDTNAAQRYVPTSTAELAWPHPHAAWHPNDFAAEQDHQGLLETMAEAFIQKEAQNLMLSSCSLDSNNGFSDRIGPTCFSARTEPPLSRGVAEHGRRSAMRPTNRSHSHVAAASEATSHSGHGDQGRQTQSGVLSESSPSGGDHDLRENSSAATENNGTHSLAKEVTAEQKRRDRHAALKKFRSKKANRSFQKKVRYACRKQLADSRPRVKGRFVGRVKPAITTSVAHARGAGPVV